MAPPLSRPRFARRVGRLSRQEVAALVADLWEARGWETRVGDARVTATREDPPRTRTIVVAPGGVRTRLPEGAADADAVVTPGRNGDRLRSLVDGEDVEVLDAEDLYGMAMYGLDRAAAKAVLWDHLGSGVGRSPLARVSPWSRAGAAVTVAVAAVLAATVAAGGFAGVPVLAFGGTGAAAAPDGGHPVASTSPGSRRSVGGDGGSRSTTVASTSTTTTAPASTVTAAAPTTSPECTRSPATVVARQMEVLRNDEVDLWIAWRYLSVEAKGSYWTVEDFVERLRSPAFAPLRNGSDVAYGPVNRSDGTARQQVTVSDADGDRVSYEFRLVIETSGANQGCWQTAHIRRLS